METKVEDKQFKSEWAHRKKDNISVAKLESMERDLSEVVHDLRWLAYVSQLDPDDDQSAFLLPDELPDEWSSREEIQTAILRATRRAFGLGSQPVGEANRDLALIGLHGGLGRNRAKLQLKDYELGYIRGELLVLLPQGKEIRWYFEDELGWKAIAIIGEGLKQRELTCYYRSICMNLARLAAWVNGDIHSSNVEFIPVGSEEIKTIIANAEVDRITEAILHRLRSQYRELANQERLHSD
jgi:hypothetical protein